MMVNNKIPSYLLSGVNVVLIVVRCGSLCFTCWWIQAARKNMIWILTARTPSLRSVMQPLCSCPNFWQNIVSLCNISMQLWANHPDEICHAENCNLPTFLDTINVTDFKLFHEGTIDWILPKHSLIWGQRFVRNINCAMCVSNFFWICTYIGPVKVRCISLLSAHYYEYYFVLWIFPCMCTMLRVKDALYESSLLLRLIWCWFLSGMGSCELTCPQWYWTNFLCWQTCSATWSTCPWWNPRLPRRTWSLNR